MKDTSWLKDQQVIQSQWENPNNVALFPGWDSVSLTVRWEALVTPYQHGHRTPRDLREMQVGAPFL